MLEDYKKYMVNIRNNLIQCGVELSMPLDTYEELLKAEGELESLIWFYSVMAISGSEYALRDFRLPLNGYYLEKMRQIFYREYQDFLKDYNQISKRSILQKQGIYFKDSNYIKPKENTDFEEQQEEVFDLFADSDDESQDFDLQESESYDNQYSEPVSPFIDESSVFDSLLKDLEDDEESDEGVEYSSHGNYLEDDEDSEEENEDVEYSSHGNYLEDFDESEDSEDFSDLSNWGNDEEESYSEDLENIEGDDLSNWGEENQETGNEEDLEGDDLSSWGNDEESLNDASEDFSDLSSWGNEEDLEGDDLSNWGEENPEEWGNDEESISENVLEGDSEEDLEGDDLSSWGNDEGSSDDIDNWGEEDLEGDDLSNWGNDEDSTSEEDLEGDDLSNWGNEEDLEGDDLSNWGNEEDLEGDDLSNWGNEEDLEGDDLSSWGEDGDTNSISAVNNSPEPSNSTHSAPKKKSIEDAVADGLQDFTNGLLTSGKTVIVKGLSKLKK